MALITMLPGMAGQLGGLIGDTVSLLESVAACGPEDPVSCFVAIIELAQVIFDVWTTFFPGRAKVGVDSATDNTALFYIPSANPVIALWGVAIRDLESLGIPLSTSGGPGLTAITRIDTAVQADLAAQFDAPGAPALTFYGSPVNSKLIYEWYTYWGQAVPNPDSNRVALNWRQGIDSFYTDLVNQGFIDPTTGFPFKPPKGPPPPGPKQPLKYKPNTPGQCQAGYTYDTVSGLCWLQHTKPDPQTGCPTGYTLNKTSGLCDLNPPPQKGKPIHPPLPQPDQDEFQDCCDETQTALTAIYNELQQLLPQGTTGGGPTGGPGSDMCCANIVTALQGLNSALLRLVMVVSASAGGKVDLAPVTSGLTAIANQLATMNAAARQPLRVDIVNAAPLVDVQVPPPDLTKVVEQLAKMVDEGDVKQNVLNYLTKQGFMTGADAQIISGASWADAIVGIFRTSGWNALIWALGLVGVTYDGTRFHFSLGAFEKAIASDFAGAVNIALAAGSAPLYPEIKGIIDGVVRQLLPAKAPVLGDSGVDGDLLVAKTLAPVLIINAVAWVVSYLGWEISENLREYVDLASELAGLAEVKEIKVGQLMQAGPIAAARLQAQNTFRQTLPGSGSVADWHARGIIDNAHTRRWLGLGGLENDVQDAQLLGAQSGIQPRQLLRLIPTGLFTDVDLQDELLFSGMRAASQHRFMLAAPYLATETWRSQLRSALEAEYAAGLISDGDLVTALDSAEHNFSRDFLILDRVHAQERVNIAKALENEYTTQYHGGLIDHATYTAHLSGLGLQQWKVDALAGIADAKLAAQLQRQMLATERQVARATAGAERRAAMEGYSTGVINEPILLATLASTGLTPTQAAAWVTLATLKRKGNLRWIYGQQLSPSAAAILKQRVADLVKQRTGEFLTDAQFVTALKDLKLPDNWINALRAKADASITPKKSAFLFPVQTS